MEDQIIYVRILDLSECYNAEDCGDLTQAAIIQWIESLSTFTEESTTSDAFYEPRLDIK